VRKDGEVCFSELTFQRAVLDSLEAHIAVLNSEGIIVAVNLSWREFAASNQMTAADAGIGVNYLDICRDANPDPIALKALDGILDVINGRDSSFYLRYPCHSASEMRWFALRASPLLDHPQHVVVSHENITSRVLSRIPPRTS